MTQLRHSFAIVKYAAKRLNPSQAIAFFLIRWRIYSTHDEVDQSASRILADYPVRRYCRADCLAVGGRVRLCGCADRRHGRGIPLPRMAAIDPCQLATADYRWRYLVLLQVWAVLMLGKTQ